MSLEGKNRSGILEAGAFAAALLGAVDHGPAQALEMSPKTPWAIGVLNNIRGAVMNEKNESQTTFIKFSDGSTVWPVVNAGEETTVTYTIGKEIKYILVHHRGKPVEVRCDFHTHPYAYKVEGPFGKLYSLPYNPPSDIDVDSARTEQSPDRFYVPLGMPINRKVSGSADSKGIWYYGPSGAEITPEQKQAWFKKFSEFVHKGTFDPSNFEFNAEYPKVREAYREHLKAEIRFVPYEEIPNEPVCAGVDYKKRTTGPTAAIHQRSVESQKKGPEVIVRPPEMSQLRDAMPTRPGLGDINKLPSRPRLDDQQVPPIYHVGPPQR